MRQPRFQPRPIEELPEPDGLPFQSLQDWALNLPPWVRAVFTILGVIAGFFFGLWLGGGGRQYAYGVLGGIAGYIVPTITTLILRIALVIAIIAAIYYAFALAAK